MKLLVRILNIILTVAGSAAAVNVVLNGFTDAFSLIFAVAVTAIQVALFVYCNVRSTSLRKARKNSTSLNLIYRTSAMSVVAVAIVALLVIYRFFYSFSSDFNIAYIQAYALVIIFVVAVVSVLFSRLLKNRMTKLSVFVSGVILTIASFIVPTADTVGIVIYCVVFFVGIGQVVAWLYSMSVEMKRVAVVVNLDDTSATYMQCRDHIGAMLIAQCVFALVVMGSVALNTSLSWLNTLQLTCSVLLILSLFFAMMQPLDRRYSNKIDQYMEKCDPNINYELLQQQLQTTLNTGRKSVFVLMLRNILKPFFPAKVRGRENVDMSEGAVVFVANHYEIYGPIVTILRMPFATRPWVNARMLDKKVLAEQMQFGVDNMCKALPKKLRNKLPDMLQPLVYKVMTSIEPIAVHRDSSREVINTFKDTVEALEQGDNILVFPEKPEAGKHYSDDGAVDAFYTGFADIGRMYYRKTGKKVRFYPVYVDKNNREIVIGEGLEYNSENPKQDEKRRIAEVLNARMQAMSEQGLAKFNSKTSKSKK